MSRFRLFKLVEHVGSVESLATHSASMTHADVPPDQLRAAGVSPGLIRLSVGIEPIEEILADLEQAFVNPNAAFANESNRERVTHA